MTSTARSSTSRRSLSSMSVTSTSLSHAISSIDNSKPPVVIEIGKKLTKCGFAGDYLPRAVCRTEFFDEFLNLRRDVMEGSAERCAPNHSSLMRFFKKLFYGHLLVMPRDRRVVIVENILWASEFRRSICKVLMEQMDVPSVLFIPGHLCATFPFNTDSALVLDVGFTETVVLPVAEGVTMLNHYGLSSLGGRSLEKRVAELLVDHGAIEGIDGARRNLTDDDMKIIEEKNLLEDICVRFLFCTKRERGLQIQQNGPAAQLVPQISEARLPYGAESLILSGYIREAACELLFENRSEDDPALPHLIHSVVARLPIDLRKQMFSGILPLGGTSLLYGFLPRLKEELIALAQERQLRTAQELKVYRFENQSLEMYAGWVGASMFASVQDAVQCRSVSREHWLDKGTIPDWTDFVESNVAAGRTDMGG